jgi:MoaA/NifB/PqqE/SkfB family radical SAM enzyme
MAAPQSAPVRFKQLKDLGKRKTLLTLGSLLAHASDKSIIRMTSVLERVARKDYYRKALKEMRLKFEAGHPSLNWIMRIVRDLDPVYRRKLMENLVLNHLVFGTEKRQQCLEDHDVYPPSAVLISPLMDCNLKCTGCYAATYQKRERLDLELLSRVVGEVKAVGTHLMFISGGEPFLRKDLFDLFEEHHDCMFGVFTNGTLLDEATCNRILALGNVIPFISVEGLERETDSRRGQGHFATIRRAMAILNEAKSLFGFSVTTTRQNAELVSSDEFVDYYADKGCLLGWYFSYVPVGREPDVNLMCTPEQRLMLREGIKRIRSTRPMGVIDFWNDGHLTGGCISAGRKYLHINHRGDVEPCAFVHFSDTNIHDNSFVDALKSPYLQRIRSNQPFDKNLMRPCQIIDRPEVLRECVSCTDARSSDGTSDLLLGDLAGDLDRYSRDFGELANRVWAEEQRAGSTTDPDDTTG